MKIRIGSVEVVIYEVSNGFRACWYEAGRRKQKFATRKADVVAFAKETAAALNANLATPSAEREAAYVKELEREMAGTPLHKAVELWKRTHRREKQTVDMRLDSLLAEWLESLAQRQLSPSYQSAAAYYVTPIVDHFGGKISAVTSDALDAWLVKRTPSLASRRHYLQYCITFFRWAMDVKKALPAGKTEPELVPLPEPKAAPIEIYTPDEMRRFLDNMRGDEIPLVVLGGFAGLRVSEITGDRTAHPPISGEDLLFKEHSIRVTQKVQTDAVARFAPLLPVAAKYLSPFKGQTGPLWKTTSTPSHVLQRLAARAKVKVLRNGFRRSFISYRTAVLRDVARVADECNTSPAKIAKNYRRPGLESVGHAWFDL